VGERNRDRPTARSFWSGRVIVVILGAVVAEYGFVRHDWVIGWLGTAVAIAAAAYASYTWFRRREVP
jgi:hypothetical protein